MGITTEYYQFPASCFEECIDSLRKPFNFSEYNAILDRATSSISIDKSVDNLYRALAGTIWRQLPIRDLWGDIAVLGRVETELQDDSYLNYVSQEDVVQVSNHLASLQLDSIEQFSDYVQTAPLERNTPEDIAYLYHYFQKLSAFYVKCQQEESWVLLVVS